MALHRTDVASTVTGLTVPFDILAASSFEGETRDAVVGLKYRNERANAVALASLLVPLVPGGTELVTWAPTSELRRMKRGIDHAELIARHLGVLTGIPARRTLRRVGEGRQTGATREQRRHSVGFVARVDPVHVRVVVIDDVVTTGATMRAAVGALTGAGYVVTATLAVAMVR